MPSSHSDTSPSNLVFGTDRPVAFVTGSGADRVGRVIAQAFLRHGYSVVLHAHRSIEQAQIEIDRLRTSGLDASLVTGPVNDEAIVRGWASSIVQSHGRIDVVVNSAASWDPLALEQVTAAEFRQAFEINLLGPSLVAKHFGLAMVAQEHGGAIINIGDWATVRPYASFAHYFTSKGAIATLTQTMAVELASRNPNIRVNAVLPGPVLLADGISSERQKQIVEHSLLKRAGTPEDVANAVLFLAESPFITGVCLPVDGGRTIYAGPAIDPVAHPNYKA